MLYENAEDRCLSTKKTTIRSYSVSRKWLVANGTPDLLLRSPDGGAGVPRFSWSSGQGTACMTCNACWLEVRPDLFPPPLLFFFDLPPDHILQGAGLRNTSVTLMLYWDHMPLTGTLFQHSVAVDTFECPGKYARR